MKQQLQREIHKIDATGQPLGRLAVKIATILRGKHKPSFVPNQDLGDFVVVENIKDIKITGKKLENKIYYRHTGYPGGLKEEKMKDLRQRKPGEILRRAVYGMLPKNKLRAKMIKRLKIS